jgi:hypothetical protein
MHLLAKHCGGSVTNIRTYHGGDGGPISDSLPAGASLHAVYERATIPATAGAAGDAIQHCDEWLVYPNVVIGICDVGSAPLASHFASGNTFRWIATRGARCAADEFDAIPIEIRAGERRPIFLFARASGTSAYVFVGRLHPSHAYGRHRGTQSADLSLRPTLPISVWSQLGGPSAPTSADTARLEEVIAAFPRAPPSDRLDLLDCVIRYWHARVPAEDLPPQGTFSHIRMPAILREWYRRVGCATSVFRQNSILEPAEVQESDGLLVFYSENQAVWEVATELEGDDPPVWMRENDAGASWEPLGPRLSEFLLQAVLLEAVFCAPYGASVAWLAPAKMEMLRGEAVPLPCPPWNAAPFTAEFHTRHGAIVVGGPNPPPAALDEGGDCDAYSVWIGGRTETAVAFARSMVDETWEYVAL